MSDRALRLVESASDLVEAHVSVPDAAAAERIARALVDRGQAACVQCLGPMASIYRWQGQTLRASEWLLLIKTTKGAFPSVCETVQELHSYDVPEVVEMPITHSLEAYGGWVRSNAKRR